MTIEREISETVYTQLITTTSILAKLAVCAILLASIASAQAASDDDSNRNGVARRSGVHAAQKVSAAKPRLHQKADQSNLARLEREWQRLQSSPQLAMRSRVVACSDFGQCDGLKAHPTPGSDAISVSPEGHALGAAVPLTEEQRVAAASSD